MKKIKTLKKNYEFKNVLSKGKFFVGKYVTIYIKNNKKNENYVAYRSQTTEIIQKKYEDRLIYFYLLTEEGLDDSSVKADAFAYMIFKIKDNQISQPYWIESYNLEV